MVDQMVVDPAAAGRRVDALLDELAATGAHGAATAEELVRALCELYGAALTRIVATLPDHEVRRLARDELLRALFVLHDLHPDDVTTRVNAALNDVRPALGAHAGDVELLAVDEEPDGVVVRLRLVGSCDGCPSSLVTVRDAIERAIRDAAPEVARLDVEGTGEQPTQGPALLQIEPRHRYADADCPAVGAAP